MLRSRGFANRTRITARIMPCSRPMPMPVEIVGLLRSSITLVWDDEHKSVYPARELRLMCRCAECIEEMTGKPLLDPRKVPDAVRARAIKLVGNYAMNIDWS